MTDTKPVAPPPESVGVVDPLRIPGAARGRQLWAAMPQLARIFLVLAAVDIVVRALGLFGTTLFLDLSYPLSVITAFFPHDALILLPAVIVLRRHDALVSAPLVTGGAIAVALAEVLGAPIRGLVSGNPVDPFAGPTLVALVVVAATAAGWIAIAEGLRPLNPAISDLSAAGLANLVAGAIGLGVLIQLASALVTPAPEVAADSGALYKLAGAALALGGLALAYLGRVVILGRGDAQRPKQAIDLATVAFVLIAIGSLLTTLLTIVVLALRLSDVASGVLNGLALLTGPVATTALVVAFGLGLADPSGTIEPVTHDTQPTPRA